MHVSQHFSSLPDGKPVVFGRVAVGIELSGVIPDNPTVLDGVTPRHQREERQCNGHKQAQNGRQLSDWLNELLRHEGRGHIEDRSR